MHSIMKRSLLSRLHVIVFLVAISTINVSSMSIRRSNDEETAPSLKDDKPRTYCSKALSMVLKQVCQEEKETLKHLYGSEHQTQERLVKGGVVAECCFEPCYKHQLVKYCRKDY